MMDERSAEQAALYAIDALEGEEKSAFETELSQDEELRTLVDELRETAAALAHSAPPRVPPPALEQKILAAIHGDGAPRSRAPRQIAWLPWAIAACLAIACTVAFSQRQRLADRLARAQKESASARNELAAAHQNTAAAQAEVATIRAEKDRAEQQVVELQQRESDSRAQMAMLAAARDDAMDKLAQLQAREERAERQAREERQSNPDRPEGTANSKVQVATLTSKSAQARNATAAIVWDAERQEGVLSSETIPPNTPDRDYQLWIVDPRFPDPVSAGVFHVERTGPARYVFKPETRIESAVAFAVSVEVRGGVRKAEGPIVLTGK